MQRLCKRDEAWEDLSGTKVKIEVKAISSSSQEQLAKEWMQQSCKKDEAWEDLSNTVLDSQVLEDQM